MNNNNKLIENFLETIHAERNASHNTLLAYRRDLEAFVYFLSKKRINLLKANRKDIETYIISLDKSGMSEATRARHLSAIKQIYRYGYDESLIKENPSTDIKGPKSKRKLPTNLSESEIDKLLYVSSQIGRSQSDKRRNSCLMHVLYATGMRVSELVSLPVASVRGDPEMLLIKGKGGKERLVPLSTPAKMAIAAYLVDWNIKQEINNKKGLQTSKFLFPSSSKLGHLTRVRFYVFIKELCVKSGISPSKVSPHTLRHAFASHLLANGADLRVIQMLLGHADVATTEIYTHVLDEKIKSLVFKHHPLAH